MSTASIRALAALLLLCSASFGCASPRACPLPATATSATATAAANAALPSRPPAPSDRRVYRLDFVPSMSDGTNAPSNLAFTLTLQEAETGEVTVGKNVVLAQAGAAGSPTSGSSPRADVGIKVKVMYRTAGEDIVLEATSEISALDPPTTVRKMVAKGSALASPGKSAQVLTLDDEHKKYQLTVTPTKLR